MLTTPVIRCLKKQIGAEIHYLTKQAFRQILDPNPYIGKVYSIESKVGEVLSQLKKERYDYIIDLHKNLRSWVVRLHLPFTKHYSFDKLNYEKWLLVKFKINRLPGNHIVDRYMEGLKTLGIHNDGAGLDFYLEETMPSIEDELPKQGYTALVIGAGHPTKALTINQITAYIDRVEGGLVLLGGKPEAEKAQQIIQTINRPVVNLVGKISLSQSAYCVQQATQVITGDTGLMHIAAAFQKPIISIWGNTVPEFGMTPYYGTATDQSKIIQNKNLSCRPCSKIGFDQCPKGHFKCMKELDLTQL